MRMDACRGILALERRAARQQLVEHAAQRIEIGARVHAQVHARAQLGRHVMEAVLVPGGLAVIGRGLGVRQGGGMAEAGEAGAAVGREQQAVGRDRAMQHAGRMHRADGGDKPQREIEEGRRVAGARAAAAHGLATRIAQHQQRAFAVRHQRDGKRGPVVAQHMAHAVLALQQRGRGRRGLAPTRDQRRGPGAGPRAFEPRHAAAELAKVLERHGLPFERIGRRRRVAFTEFLILHGVSLLR